MTANITAFPSSDVHLKKQGTYVSSNDNIPILKTLDVNAIMDLIPHRYPMLLVDRLHIFEYSKRAEGIKNVSFNEWFFEGHFPGKPIMPGVLIVEAMAQAAAALVMQSMKEDGVNLQEKLVYFMSIESSKFRKPVVPGDRLHLEVEREKQRGPVWRFKGTGRVDNAVTSEAQFTAMIVDK